MLELFLTTLVIFLFFMIFFYFLSLFKMMQYILFLFQFIVCLILLSNNFYKEHILWKEEEPIMIKNLSFEPLSNIEPIYNSDHTFSKFSYSHISGDFSLEKTEYYYNECLENYFVSSSICPITDIIIEDKRSNHENYNEIKIDNNKYIYFTNIKKDGRLYNGEYDVSLAFKSSFDYQSAKKLKKIEEDKLSNPLLEFKYFINYSDYVCLTLLIFYLIQSRAEKCQNRKFNYFKILNILIQIALLIIYSIRYNKFIKVKQYFFDNEFYYNYKDEEKIYFQNGYYPNKVFNIDSFPIGVTINILIINLLYVIIPNKYHIKNYNDDRNECDCRDNLTWKASLILLTLPCFIFYFACAILNASDEKKVLEKYNNLLYNWKTNPIKTIELTDEEVNKYELFRIQTDIDDRKYYIWRNNYFEVEKLNNFNYLNIYYKENGKLCGKDSYGNNLYFPEGEECPINDLFIKNEQENIGIHIK